MQTEGSKQFNVPRLKSVLTGFP